MTFPFRFPQRWDESVFISRQYLMTYTFMPVRHFFFQDPLAAGEAYKCLVTFSEARRNVENKSDEKSAEGDDLIVFDSEKLDLSFNSDKLDNSLSLTLGPRVYSGTTLIYQMFGFKGPLWMTQTCNGRIQFSSPSRQYAPALSISLSVFSST
jgi:hypothetical protein